MRKLKLNLDALAVTSFDTDGAGARTRGTAHAHMPNPPVEETDNTCPSYDPSCDVTACANDTCVFTSDCVTDTRAVFCH